MLIECPIIIIFISLNSSFNYDPVIRCSLKFSKLVSKTVFIVSSFYMFSIAHSQSCYILSLLVLQICCHSLRNNVPHWLQIIHWLLIILILLLNDIQLNSGPTSENELLKFMTWNLAKDNFQRLNLIEATNSIFDYDLISINETSLNDTVELPETLLDDYTFVLANNTANTRHGGVGLFYKNSLPVIVRNDLSFDESIVVELKFVRKKILFKILYRSPAFNHSIAEFQTFLSNFKQLYRSIKSENPLAMFFAGDLNAHSQMWWSEGNTTPEGVVIEDLFTSLGLHQLICEPTNFETNKNPSCIDLVVTDQSILVLDSGT